MTTTFENPGGGGDMLPISDVNGKAVILRPTEHIESITTIHGDRDAIKLDVVDLSTGTLYRDVLWFGGRIIGQTKHKIGTLILAQVTQGATSKPGQNPPWDLVGLTDNPQVVAAAEAWMAANPGAFTSRFTAPAATAPQTAAPIF